MRALVLIDLQTGFDDPVWGQRNNPDAEVQAGRLLAHWRDEGWPIWHVRHLSVETGSPLTSERGGVNFKPEVLPMTDERVIEKSVNSCFIGTPLESELRQAGVSGFVCAGLTTPHCVSTTARMGSNIGFDVTVAHDACAAFTANANTGWSGAAPATARAIHEAALDHLHGEFATVASVGEIVFP